jgi:hypothetical protein
MCPRVSPLNHSCMPRSTFFRCAITAHCTCSHGEVSTSSARGSMQLRHANRRIRLRRWKPAGMSRRTYVCGRSERLSARSEPPLATCKRWIVAIRWPDVKMYSYTKKSACACNSSSLSSVPQNQALRTALVSVQRRVKDLEGVVSASEADNKQLLVR